MNAQKNSAAHATGLALALAFVVLQCLDITTYPLVNGDEALLNDAGWQLATTGRFRADILALYHGSGEHYLWQVPGLGFAAAVSYELFGFGIWQTRLTSILFGGLGVWAIFALVRSITQGTTAGPTGAWLAALSLFLWPDWMLTAKESRMDTAAIAALLLSSLLVVRSLRGGAPASLGRLFLAGLCTSVATIFHSAALPWGAALGIVVFIFAANRFRSALVFGLGAAALGAAWLAYALQFPQEFQAQYLSLLLDRSGGGGILERIAAEATRYGVELRRTPTLYLLALFALCGVIMGRLWTDPGRRMLLTLAALVVFLHALVAGKHSGFYTLYPTTLIFCVIGIGVEACLAESGAPHRRRWLAAGATVAALAFLANAAVFSVGPRVLAYWFQGPQRDYALQMAPLSSRLKPGDQVWGSAVAWFAVVKAGARQDVFNWMGSMPEDPRPDPLRHKYAIVDRDDQFIGREDYRKILELGSDLPLVFGSPLADRPYTFDLWQSNALP
ncbi:MAG: glycosyltransferase family 39 protein [Reyranella sp.]|nr:glycosyltransferase family 39 protein [Reyranella sp.]MDP3162725.1 glycosyltransferase family 39 protein [Reyranella sp.]